jgi:hypothetical protein
MMVLVSWFYFLLKEGPNGGSSIGSCNKKVWQCKISLANSPAMNLAHYRVN